LISPHSPLSINSGAGQRTRLIYNTLQINNDVDLFLISDPADQDKVLLIKHFNLVACKPISPYGTRRYYRFFRHFSPWIVDRIAYHSLASKVELGIDDKLSNVLTGIFEKKRYDFIVARYLKSASLTNAFQHAPVLVDIDDLDIEVWQSRLGISGDSLFRKLLMHRYLNSLNKEFPKLIHRTNGVWVAKSSDLQKVIHQNIAVLPNIPYHYAIDDNIRYPLPWGKDNQTIIIVASLGWAPNKDGLNFFLENIWPLVIARLPDANLKIIGSGLDEETKARWSEILRVDVLGFVENIVPYYQHASFSIAPLYHGGGTNIKVLESLSYGRPCVCSTHAARGFEDVEGLYVCESADIFAKACLKLLKNREECVQKGHAGFEYVNYHFTYSVFQKAVNHVLYNTDVVDELGGGLY